MKLAAVEVDGSVRVGVVSQDMTAVRVLPADLGDLDDVIREGPAGLDRIRDAVGGAPASPLTEVCLRAPLHRFNRDVLCTGWNYWDHFDESRGRREGQDPHGRPEHPTFFTKGPGTVIGPRDAIAFDLEISDKWDYEAEIALVIGRDGRSVPQHWAREHILGLCMANDVSHRDLQRRHGGQWLKGKSIDATMPLGPWITTLDEIEDLYSLRIRCELNGRLMQDASTAQVAFSFERLIAELSWGMTLRAGDVVLTGTPSGVGNARDPQVFLAAGDELVTTVSGLGELRNPVQAVDRAGRLVG